MDWELPEDADVDFEAMELHVQKLLEEAEKNRVLLEKEGKLVR